mgnify:CR=1 FL=1
MIYGYARVSTKDQNLSRQLVDIINFGVLEQNIYKDFIYSWICFCYLRIVINHVNVLKKLLLGIVC